MKILFYFVGNILAQHRSISSRFSMKGIYFPSFDGRFERIDHIAHDGITLRLPFPRKL